MTTVLIVDDAALIRAQLKQLLEEHDFKVIGEAENGKVALMKIKELKPDIVTLDIAMPVMDGIECMVEMNKLDYKPDVVMISAMGQESFVKKAFVHGVKDFIVKPYKADVLLNHLKKFKKEATVIINQ